MSENSYSQFVKRDNDYTAVDEGVSLHKKLKPGFYKLLPDMNGKLHFISFKNLHDEIVDLPSPEYSTIVKELELFMLPETRKKFQDNGFVYKRSTLLYGKQGSGKTCLVNRLANKHIERGGLVFFNPNPNHLQGGFEILSQVQPETPIMVIFEEFDDQIVNHEHSLLHLLDGEVQQDNVIYIATTNHLDKVPERLRRPGRMSSTIEVKFPSAETRRYYLEKKLKITEGLDEWVEKTDGFSIDELKETVQAVVCLNYPLDEIVDRLRGNRQITPSDSDKSNRKGKVNTIFNPLRKQKDTDDTPQPDALFLDKDELEEEEDEWEDDSH